MMGVLFKSMDHSSMFMNQDSVSALIIIMIIIIVNIIITIVVVFKPRLEIFFFVES